MPELERIPSRKQRILELASLIAKLGQGNIITWNNLQALANLTRDQVRSLIPSLDKILMQEYGIFLDNIRGKGYLITPIDSQATLVESRFRRCINRSQKAAATVRYIQFEEIQDEAIRSQEMDKSNRILQVAFLMERGVKALNILQNNLP